MVGYELKNGILRIDCKNWVIEPSIEDSDACMAVVIDLLREVKNVEKIVLAEKREIEYEFNQVKLLAEIAELLNKIEAERFLERIEIGPEECNRYYPERIKELFFIVREVLRKDPVGAWIKLNRMVERTKFLIQKLEPNCKKYFISFLTKNLEYLKRNLEACQLIKNSLTLIKKPKPDRRIYKEFFKPVIKPVFMFTRFKLIPPKEGYCIERYKIPGDIQVEIYRIPGKVRFYYFITPPEFMLSEEKHELIEKAIAYLSERRPSELEFREPEKTRETYFSLGKSVVKDLAARMKIFLKEREVNELASILTRYTTGFGILEVLLSDEKIQDIYINAPIGSTPIFVQHSDFEECETNLIPTMEDAEAWATRFRMYSGRPLDEANPVLDTELLIPGGRARICAITRGLSPEGLAFAIRRHREKPWTFPLFMNLKMFDPLFAGLMSFIIDGGRSILVAGGRGSGKTSFLSGMILEIMKKFRVIVLEDSVTGDTEILIKRNGNLERRKVGELIDGLIEKYGCEKIDGREILNSNPENIEVFSLNKEGKIEVCKVSSFHRHKVKKEIFEIETRTGRRIKVTSDHSLFTLGDDGKIVPIKTKELKVGSYLAVPRILPISSSNLKSINLLDGVEKLGKVMVFCERIEGNWKFIKEIGEKLGYSKAGIRNWKKTSKIPVEVFKELIKNIKIKGKLKIKSLGNSNLIPAKIKLDHDFLCFIGLWLADGCYDENSVIISVVDKDTRKIVRKIAKRFGIKAKMHPDGFSLMLNSRLLKRIMVKTLKLEGNSYTKRIPDWAFKLSKDQISWLLKGIFSGDGCLAKDEVLIRLTSRNLLKDIQTLLLSFGIISRIGNFNKRDKTYSCRISSIKMFKKFYEEIGFLQMERMKKLKEMCERKFTHDISDIIPFSIEFKEKLSKILPEFNKYDYVCRNYNLGREKLNHLIKNSNFDGSEEFKILKDLANSDIFWDEIRSIKCYESEEYVYDFSVPGNENFVCENIIAHNTLEIPVTQIRDLGFNIERLKSRSVITRVETELPAEEALRTALRLGDSVLIIGEVRSSLRGDQEVLIVKDGITQRVKIAELEKMPKGKILVPTLDKNYKIKLEKLHHFVKHPKRNRFIEIVTETGRKVVVTPEHSVFTVKNFEIVAEESEKLKEGDAIIIPSKLPNGFKDVKYLNLLEILEDSRVVNAEKYIRKAIKRLGWKNASKICGINDIYVYLRRNEKTRIPAKIFKKLMEESKIKFNLSELKVKRVTSNELPAKLKIDKDFCRLLGYYVSEGCITLNRISITNSNEKIISDIVSIFNKLGFKPYIREIRGWGKSKQVIVGSSLLVDLLKKLGCGTRSKEKRIPAIIFGLNEKKILAFLESLYRGDGSLTISKSSGNTLKYITKSLELANDLLYLLLSLGVVAFLHRKFDKRYNNWLYEVVVKRREDLNKLLAHMDLLQNKKLIQKSFSKSSLNILTFDPKILEKYVKLKRKFRHLRRTKKCTKYYLKKVVEECGGDEKIKKFANGDFFIDRIKEKREILIKNPEYVFDLSVNPTENFVGGFGGIILHNTEALALYEAMRIGALANLVAGTIHGESAYGVFDRVVHDLGVPSTSFKATDLIVISSNLKSADGLHRFRRITELVEVKKHWKEDPLEEEGFTTLMQYSAKEDKLKPTDVLLEGESFVLNEIAKKVREWHANWDAVWDNILLRAKIKETMLELALKLKNPEILEARTVSDSNEMFHLFSEQVKQEVGSLDSKLIYEKWLEWFKRYLKT